MKKDIKDHKQIDNNYDFSVPLDVFIWSNIPAIKYALNLIFRKIMATNPIGIKEKRLKYHLKTILTNLYLVHKFNNKMYLGISLNKNNYSSSSRLSKLYLNYENVKLIVDFLKSEGYIDYHKGIYSANFRRNSRIKSTQKLLRIFRRGDKNQDEGKIIRRVLPIFLRDKDKKDIDYDINRYDIMMMIKNVNRVNEFLAYKKISLEFNNWMDWEDYMSSYARYTNYNKYSRIFNENFDCGGRWYGHWSQFIPSSYRKFITIEGEKTVELDYSCLHIYILYCLENLIPPQGDLYELSGISDSYRKLIKFAVNIALNAQDELSATRAINLEAYKFCKYNSLNPTKAADILSGIKNKHPILNKYMFQNYGIKLQNKDSQVAENILLSLVGEKIPCLCIHDSFIVAQRHKERLQYFMEYHFKNMFGQLPRITEKASDKQD